MILNPLTVVYNSGLQIDDPFFLSTLAIFYDRIILPAETSRDSNGIILHSGYHGHEWRIFDFTWTQAPSKDAFDEPLKLWEQRNKPLFEHGVISRLASPDRLLMELGKDNLIRLMEYINKIWNRPERHTDPYYQSFSRFLGTDANNVPDNRLVYMDMYFHRLRQDVTLPSIFAVPNKEIQREQYKSLMAQSTLKYLLPKFSELEPEQILEMREVVADHREGFSMHLQSLSAGVEDRVKGGETLEQISKYAQSIIDTQLIPDYREFSRILEAAEKRRKGKILDIGGKFMEIDAPIGSLKFFGQLLQAFGGGIITDAEEYAAQLTNRNQAFYFMRAIEKNQHG